jgi:hypothetical protein
MSKRYQLCVTDAKTGIVSVKRHIKLEEGVRLVEQEKAEPVLHDESGVVIGFELRMPKREAAQQSLGDARGAGTREGFERNPKASCTAFSKAEVDAIVGLRGKSQTAHLTEDQKAERIRKRWAPEDMVECAQQKIAVYQDVH